MYEEITDHEPDVFIRGTIRLWDVKDIYTRKYKKV